MRRFVIVALALGLMAVGQAAPVHAQAANDAFRVTPVQPLVQPQPTTPWIQPVLPSPPNLSNTTLPPSSRHVPRINSAKVPPPIYVPETGQLLPNDRITTGSGRGGRETHQDRAARCAHQAGEYGARAGNRNAYIGMCINQ